MEFGSLSGIVAWFAYKLLVSCLILAVGVVGGLVAQSAIVRASEFRGVPRDLGLFLGKVAKISLYVVGAVCALGTFGINVTALVAGLGLTGFALGFALKDIVSNTLAGILVIIYRPFQPGDEIKVGAFQGNVVSIDLRYTTLEANDRRHLVPNSLLFSNAVTVFAAVELAEEERASESGGGC